VLVFYGSTPADNAAALSAELAHLTICSKEREQTSERQAMLASSAQVTTPPPAGLAASCLRHACGINDCAAANPMPPMLIVKSALVFLTMAHFTLRAWPWLAESIKWSSNMQA